MTLDPAVMAARARLEASKARLDSSVSHVKARLSPRSLAADAVETVTEKATHVAHSGVQIVKDRPATTAAVIGAIGLAMARKPVFGWIRSLFSRDDATGGGDAS